MKKVITAQDYPQFYTRIEAGAFLVAYPEHKGSVGIELTSSEISSGSYQSILDQFFSQWKSEHPLKIKVVCNFQASTLQRFLNQQNIHIENEIITESAFEILYFPAEGRLKYAQDVNVQKTEKAKVLIIDDSKTLRMLLQNILSSDPNIEVVGLCENPLNAEKMIEELKPNVITLDMHMPEQDGLSLLRKIVPKYHLPVIMLTSVNNEEGSSVIQALEEGAVDYIKKPSSNDLNLIKEMILEKIHHAAKAKVKFKKTPEKYSNTLKINEQILQDKIIAIGASTGGVDALRAILTQLPANIPPIVITQHIPAVFSRTFANRLNDLCAFEVREAKDGDEILPGLALVAEGGKQFKIEKKNGKLFACVNDDDHVNRHKPSVDYLFNSVATTMGQQAIGLLLTGMGSDGAQGLLKMKQAGALTIAQNEQSCVVFGMPKEAIKLGAADLILDLQEIPANLIQNLKKKKSA